MTPNVVGFVAYVKCRGGLESIRNNLSPDSRAIFDANLQQLAPGALDRDDDPMEPPTDPNFQASWPSPQMAPSNSLNLLIMERATHSRTMYNWLKGEKNKDVVVFPEPQEHEIASVMFQLLFTLEVFNRMGLRHNDLHMRNIMVQDLLKDSRNPTDLHFEYAVTDSDGNELKRFRIPATNLALIYDFDRASVASPAFPANRSNTLSTWCKTYGECNRENPFFDTYKVMAALANDYRVDSMPYEVGQRLCKRHISPELFFLEEKAINLRDGYHFLRKPVGDLPSSTGPKAVQLLRDLLLAENDADEDYYYFKRNPRTFMRDHGVTDPNIDPTKWFKKRQVKKSSFRADGDFIPKQYPFAFWMHNTLEILLHEPRFDQVRCYIPGSG